MKDHLDHLSILITTAVEDTDESRRQLEGRGARMVHLPLERYQIIDEDQAIDDAFNNLNSFENIIYGHKRNAIFFAEHVKRQDKIEEVRQRLNLTLHADTAEYLEEQGIVAVSPQTAEKPIDLIEFMLRLQRYGATLYPCGNHQRDEIPGLLQELDIPVNEISLYDLKGPQEEDLDEFKKKIGKSNPDAIVYHSKRAVNRITAAFPDLKPEDKIVISANPGVTQKLKENEIPVTIEADGSWHSIAQKLAEYQNVELEDQ